MFAMKLWKNIWRPCHGWSHGVSDSCYSSDICVFVHSSAIESYYILTDIPLEYCCRVIQQYKLVRHQAFKIVVIQLLSHLTSGVLLHILIISTLKQCTQCFFSSVWTTCPNWQNWWVWKWEAMKIHKHQTAPQCSETPPPRPPAHTHTECAQQLCLQEPHESLDGKRTWASSVRSHRRVFPLLSVEKCRR